MRAAQSKPIDLVCIRKGKSILVECKAGRSFLTADRKKELLDLGVVTGVRVVLARRKQRKVELVNLADGQPLDPGRLGEL